MTKLTNTDYAAMYKRRNFDARQETIRAMYPPLTMLERPSFPLALETPRELTSQERGALRLKQRMWL